LSRRQLASPVTTRLAELPIIAMIANVLPDQVQRRLDDGDERPHRQADQSSRAIDGNRALGGPSDRSASSLKEGFDRKPIHQGARPTSP